MFHRVSGPYSDFHLDPRAEPVDNRHVGVDDDAVLWLLKLLLDASGKQEVPQGGVISPLLSNLYLNEVDQMLERAKEVTRSEGWTAVEYARFADDLVILVDSQPRQQLLRQAV